MKGTPTISAEAKELLIKIARDAGYVVLEKIRAEGHRAKVLVLKSNLLPRPIVVHKDSGRTDDKLVKLKVAIAPSMFIPALADGQKVSVAVNRNSGTHSFRHSAYHAFAQSDDGREPVGYRYEIDWALGGPDALRTLLNELKDRAAATP